MKICFIGLGDIGGKLAGSLQRNVWHVCCNDLSAEAMAPMNAAGEITLAAPALVTKNRDLVITCLPSPMVFAAVMAGRRAFCGSSRRTHYGLNVDHRCRRGPATDRFG